MMEVVCVVALLVLSLFLCYACFSLVFVLYFDPVCYWCHVNFITLTAESMSGIYMRQ